MTNTTYTVTPRRRVSSGDWLEDAFADLEFTVQQTEYAGDGHAPWYTVIARPADNKDGYRFAVYSGSPIQAGTIRAKKRLDRHAIVRLEVIEAVKAYLAAN